MKELSKKTILREWVIFAVSLGLGAHVALGVLLHGSQPWPTEWYGMYGVLFGVFIYVILQVGRSLWWVWKGSQKPSNS